MKLITEAQLNKLILEETRKLINETIDSEEGGFLSKLTGMFKRRKPEEDSSLPVEAPLSVDDERLKKGIDNYMNRYHRGQKYEIGDIDWGRQDPLSSPPRDDGKEPDMEEVKKEYGYKVMVSFEEDEVGGRSHVPGRPDREREYIMWVSDDPEQSHQDSGFVEIPNTDPPLYIYGEQIK